METVQLVGTGSLLCQQPSGYDQLLGKDLLQPKNGRDLALNVAHHPAKISVQLADLSAHAPGLSGIVIAVAIQALGTQSRIALTQAHSVPLTQPHQALPGTIQQLAVVSQIKSIRIQLEFLQ